MLEEAYKDDIKNGINHSEILIYETSSVNNKKCYFEETSVYKIQDTIFQ